MLAYNIYCVVFFDLKKIFLVIMFYYLICNKDRKSMYHPELLKCCFLYSTVLTSFSFIDSFILSIHLSCFLRSYNDHRLTNPEPGTTTELLFLSQWYLAVVPAHCGSHSSTYLFFTPDA